MTDFTHNMNKKLRWHGNIVAYIILAVGLVGAVWLIQREIDHRQGADRKIREVVRVETDQESRRRIAASEKQIKALKVINNRQNQIIRALLRARGQDPSLFDGAALPGDGTRKGAEQSSAPSPVRTHAQPTAAQRPQQPRSPKEEGSTNTSTNPSINPPPSNPPSIITLPPICIPSPINICLFE